MSRLGWAIIGGTVWCVVASTLAAGLGASWLTQTAAGVVAGFAGLLATAAALDWWARR